MNIIKLNICIRFILIGLFLPLNVSATEEIVFTKAGKEVILNSDGTWEYKTNNITKNDTSKKHSLRSVDWGMTKLDVENAEKAGSLISKKSDELIYTVNISGIDGVLAYKFIDNKLVSATYIFTEENSNKNKFLTDYSLIDDALQSKYGHAKVTPYWSNSLYKDDTEKYGFAVTIGHVQFSTKWKSEATSIEHVLKGNNYEATHGILYRSLALSNLVESQKQAKVNKGL